MKRQKFDQVVDLLRTAKDNAGHTLAMKNVTISDPGGLFSHNFVSSPGLTDLRSVSKVPLCMAVGIAIDREYRVWGEPFSLDTHIFPLLEPYAKSLPLQQRSLLEQVQLRHLLANTTGHSQGFLFRKDIGDRPMSSLLQYIVDTPVVHAPGTHFSFRHWV
jgi:CubicO group peptidase (beta-lactamase class C family)